MSNYNKSSKQLAINLINERLDVKIKTNDVEINNVVYLDEGYYNTRAELEPVLGSSWQNPVIIEYDRKNISHFFLGVPVIVEPNYQRRLSEFLPTINYRYGLSLSKEDIIDGVIPEGVTPPYSVNIKITDNNPAFYGNFNVIVSNEDKSLKAKLSGVNLGKIKFSENDDGKILGPLYLYGYDFTEYYNQLITYPKTGDVDNTLIKIINSQVEDGWVNVKEELEFNLFGSKIIYNGMTTHSYEYSTNKEYTNVMIIELDKQYCNNVSGYLVIHYNHFNNTFIL